MIVDAVVGNDELDIASFRIKYLQEAVSVFYIAESEQTFQGRKKPLNFTPALKHLKKTGADVRIVVVPQHPDDHLFSDAWQRGRYQRYWFLEQVAKAHPEATIIFSDIDEVPSLEQIRWAEKNLDPQAIGALPMRFSFRFANWFLEPVSQKYNPAVILRASAFRPDVREQGEILIPGEEGAHLSYVGFDEVQLKEKLSSFEHTELDLSHLYQSSVIDFANTWGIDHLGRPGQPGFGLLAPAKPQQLNGVLRSAIQRFPQWYRDFPTRPLLRRLVASSALSKYRTSGDRSVLDDPDSYALSWRFLRHLLSLFLHTTIRLTHTGKLVKRAQELLTRSRN